MRETKKIEKQLFKDEPIFLKEVEENKGQKEIKKWKWTMNEYKNPDEVEVEMKKAKKNKKSNIEDAEAENNEKAEEKKEEKKKSKSKRSGLTLFASAARFCIMFLYSFFLFRG